MWRALKRFFFGFPGWLDANLRWLDLRFHRTDEKKSFPRLAPGYSSAVVWLPVPVLLALAYGMPRPRGWLLAVACALAVAIHLIVTGTPIGRGRRLARAQWLLAVALALGVFAAGYARGASEVDAAPYPHLFGLFGAIVLTLAMPASRWFAGRLIGRQRDRFRRAFAPHLDATQLFVRPPSPRPGALRIVRAYALVPISSPLLLAIVPVFGVLVADRRYVWWTFFIALAVAWMGLAAVHYHDRLRTFQLLARQMLLIGGPRVVSLVVVVFAAARLADVSYVTTVLDQASAAVIVGTVLIFYLIFWLYDYWMQRGLAEVLLGLLTTAAEHPRSVPYRTSRYGESSRLQIHGAGRFIALRDAPAAAAEGGEGNEGGGGSEGAGLEAGEPPAAGPRAAEYFESYRPLEVFGRLVEQLEGRVRAGKGTWSELDEARDGLDALREKARLYAAIPAVIIAVLVVGTGLHIFDITQEPGLEAASAVAEEKLFDLGERLSQAPPGERLYAVAASGGGTRAALYTYAVLRALEAREALDRVVLLSGVSGGSAGIAAFAADPARLLAGDEAAWEDYRAALAAPHIEDVLRGAGEWRFVRGVRLGQLLTESFARHFHPADASAGSGCRTLGCATEQRVGLVFNTSVVARWVKQEPESECMERHDAMHDCATVSLGGSRLVLTNLRSMTEESVATPLDGWPLDFDYAVVRDPETPLATAASLSANFPPVFSNAAVDLGPRDDGGLAEIEKRYWVTDGGAVENRGMIGLLLALRAESEHLRRGAGEPVRLPDLTILVAEASGLSFEYKEDRGIGAAGGAKAKIANKLIAELGREVRQAWRELSGGGAALEVVYLPLPDALRTAFGTHWQMPNAIVVRDPETWYADRWYAARPGVALDEHQLLEVVDLLFASPEERLRLGLDSPEEVAELWNLIVPPGDDAYDPYERLDAALTGGRR